LGSNLRSVRGRPEKPPEERARDALIESAREALRDAERAYASQRRDRRKDVRRAERAYAGAVRAAQKELRDAESTEAEAIRALEERIASVASATEIARYGGFRLREDRIEAAGGAIPVVAGLRALVLPGEVLARSRPGSTALDQILDANGYPRRRRTVKPERMYLSIETPGSRLLIEVHDEDGARDFARAVDVAALNADSVARARAVAAADIAPELTRLRHQRAEAVEQAAGKLEAAEGDRAAVEEAEEKLAEAELATGEIVERRETLTSLERSRAEQLSVASAAPAGSPPESRTASYEQRLAEVPVLVRRGLGGLEKAGKNVATRASRLKRGPGV
jgi:hypothetical protein